MGLVVIGVSPCPQWDPRRETVSSKRTLASRCFFRAGDRRAHMALRTRLFSKDPLGTDIEIDDDLETTFLWEVCSSWVGSTWHLSRAKTAIERHRKELRQCFLLFVFKRGRTSWPQLSHLKNIWKQSLFASYSVSKAGPDVLGWELPLDYENHQCCLYKGNWGGGSGSGDMTQWVDYPSSIYQALNPSIA